MNSYANIFSYFITGVGTVIIVYLIGRLIDWFRQVIFKGLNLLLKVNNEKSNNYF